VQDEVDEGRVLAARQRLDLAQDLQVLLVPALAAFEQLERLLDRQRIREEQPQERLVAQLDRRRRAEQPLGERLVAGRRELVDPALAPPPRAASVPDRSGRSSRPRRSASSGRRRS